MTGIKELAFLTLLLLGLVAFSTAQQDNKADNITLAVSISPVGGATVLEREIRVSRSAFLKDENQLLLQLEHMVKDVPQTSSDQAFEVVVRQVSDGQSNLPAHFPNPPIPAFPLEVGSKAFLGVASSTRPCDHEPNTEGVTITQVAQHSPASNAGIHVGDVLISINNQKISSHQELAKVVHGYRARDPLMIDLRRNDQPYAVEVILAEQLVKDHKENAHHVKTRDEQTDSLVFVVQHLCKQALIEHCNQSSIAVSEKEMAGINGQFGHLLDAENALQLERFIVSPNPSRGVFHIEASLKGEAELVVVDVNGRLVYQETVDFNEMENPVSIDLSSEPNGSYFLSLTQRGKRLSTKLIKL